MGSHRMVYLLSLGVCVAFYFLYEPWFSWYLLVTMLLLPPFDLLVSLPGMRSRRLLLMSPEIIEQGESGQLILEVKKTAPFPAGGYKLSLSESGEFYARAHRLLWGGVLGSRTRLPIDTKNSGFINYSARRIWVKSLMGLFSLPISLESGAGVLVLPKPLPPPDTVALPRNTALIPKPGGGFSEDHDIRPYRQGEPVSSVHWKLSAKHDSLMIREALMHPPQSRLVRGKAWSTAEERDLVLGRLRWVSEYLIERDCPHFVQLEQSGEVAEISSESELIAYLARALDSSASKSIVHTPLPLRFTWLFEVDAREVES